MFPPIIHHNGRYYELRLSLGPSRRGAGRVLSRWEAERLLTELMHRGGCAELRQFYMSIGSCHSITHISNQQVLDALITRLDRGFDLGVFSVVEVDPFERAKPPTAPLESKEAQRVEALLKELGPADLHHRGDLYRLVRAPKQERVENRRWYEVIDGRKAHVVLQQMATEDRRNERQKAIIADLAQHLEKPRLEPDAELLVLRRIRMYTLPPGEASESMTPSQLRSSSFHYIEVETVAPDGKPVSGVQLEVVLASGGTTRVRTNEQGLSRLDNLQPGTLAIRVKGLENSSWRPAAGAPKSNKRAASCTHSVQKGEGLARIAKRYGQRDWRALWEASENKELREKRTNPNRIRPGDRVFVPGAEVGEIERATNQRHRIIIERPPAVVAVLNAHKLSGLNAVHARWTAHASDLSASSALHEESTGKVLKMDSVPGPNPLLIVPKG